ncbi:hypothetical protein [Beijerinckia sp. L45]|uniref:hypothetical protein n=1 Tax=Beijerinckia sp. L45 TaxID=1641855 RepID=UPI001FEDC4A4|nr:hypothetical protein [Beijerinckia sp. L45]
MPDIIDDLRENGIEVGIVVVAAAEAGALADASKLLHAAKGWAAARFVIANELRGTIDPGLLKKAAGSAVVEHLRQFMLDDQARSVLAASGLRGIPAIDKQALIKAYSPAVANRIMKDLTAFRLAAMQAVKPAALWVIDAVEG